MTIIIIDVFNIIQKVPDIVIHLQVDDDSLQRNEKTTETDFYI